MEIWKEFVKLRRQWEEREDKEEERGRELGWGKGEI